MDDGEWRTYLAHLRWECPKCGTTQVGAAERQPGRVTGRCHRCGWFDLLFIWGGDGWLYAPSSGIILERD